MTFNINSCEICPRKCRADRTKTQGFCGGKDSIRLAKVSVHMWEEPCISGTRGSGTVFFSGCPLKCCFCQNYKISSENFGIEISHERLSEIFLELQDKGVHNINLVNPTHYIPWVKKALEDVKDKLHIPVVYNSGGYERTESLKTLRGLIDIYLPDLKFINSDASKKYTLAPDYFEYASSAILEMYSQVGEAVFDENGMMKKGLIIRHLAMPSLKDDSIEILRWIDKNLPKDKILLSLMSQYTPFYKSCEHKEINRRISTYEYQKITDEMLRLGFTNGYTQQRESAQSDYIPDFNLSGVLKDNKEI